MHTLPGQTLGKYRVEMARYIPSCSAGRMLQGACALVVT